MTSTVRERALYVDCPQCGAEPGQPCTYMMTSNLRSDYVRSKKVQAQIDRVGQPTKHPHNERTIQVRTRMDLERERIRARERARQRAEEKRSMPPTVGQLQILNALQDYDLQEHEKLKTWLREYGPLLWEKA